MNFHPPYIVHSKTCKSCYVDVLAKKELERLRREYMFAMLEIFGCKISWFNTKSYNAHKEHFLADKGLIA